MRKSDDKIISLLRCSVAGEWRWRWEFVFVGLRLAHHVRQGVEHQDEDSQRTRDPTTHYLQRHDQRVLGISPVLPGTTAELT